MKKLTSLVLALLLVFSLTACSGQSAETTTATTETPTTVAETTTVATTAEETTSAAPTTQAEVKNVVEIKQNLDGKDYSFEFEKSPTRVVSMSQATTEIFWTLGLADKMVGTAFLEEEIYAPLQAEYDKVPVLAEKWPSYEEFMAATPDFTTGWAVPFTKRAIPAQKIVDQGIVIYVPNSMTQADATLDTLFDDFLTIGKIFENEVFAQAYVDDQKAKLEEVKAKISDKGEKRVFLYDSEDDQPFTVFEGYTTNLLNLIGAKNVMSGQGSDKTWGKASWESVVAANPEYIIVVDYGVSIRNTDDFDQKVEKIKNNPMLAEIDAVKNDNFIRVKLSEITPGVRSVDSLVRLSETIHGK